MIAYYVNYNCLRKQLALVCVSQVSHWLIVALSLVINMNKCKYGVTVCMQLSNFELSVYFVLVHNRSLNRIPRC